MELTPEQKAALRVDSSDSYKANALPRDFKPGIPPSGVQLLPTRAIRYKESGVEATINSSDFDPAVHEDASEKKAPAGAGGNALEGLTVAVLTELASERKVDLGGATKKADIVAALVAAGVTAP